MTVKVNHSTPADGTFSAQGALAWDADHTLAGLGTMAEQNSNNVNITGGSITGITIGSATNIAGGTANQLLYQTGAGATSFITAPTVAGTYLNWSGSAFQWSANPLGDVVGPASATDNAIARFDLTTGKLIQNSTVTLDDNGNAINVNSVGFDTTPATVPATVGTMSWDDGDGVPIVALKGGNVNLQVGTQELARVFNDSGTTLTKGQAVYISGAQGNRVAVKLARADVEATSFGTLGLVAETITNGAEGFVIVSGALYKLNTMGLVAGATVYVSPTTPGALTTTKPQAPDQLVVVGWVERVDNIVGSIYVKVDNGYEIDELHDVRITNPISGNVLIYDATTSPIGVWKNGNISAGTAISVTNGAGSVTIANTGVTALSAGTGISVSGSTGNVSVTNTAPDQIVALTGAGTTTISGTYPNFTITSNDQYTGTVTAVTGTAPIASSGGTTPAISIPKATGSVDGYLSAADWTTFNSKVTSVSGTTGRITSSGGTTPAIDLASGIVSAGTTGSSTAIPVITVDTYGRVTNITTASNPQGTVTSVGGTGTVSGISLSGTVTSSGNLTLGGSLDLSSPPAIGGSVPNAITGTTITASQYVNVGGGNF